MYVVEHNIQIYERKCESTSHVKIFYKNTLGHVKIVGQNYLEVVLFLKYDT